MPEGSDRDAPTLLVDPATRPASETSSSPSSKGTTLPRGQRVEHYVVLDELGRGGMSVVHRAYDARLHREVALKVLHAASDDDDASARMLREARAMAQLAHPNVVPVYDAGRTDARDWVAMELVDGENLRDWLSAKPRTVDATLRVMLAAGRGLQAAHDKGLVHRDFKPSNVLVGPATRVRVTDFGLARTADVAPSTTGGRADDDVPPHGATGPLSEPLTRRGTVMGTPPYMPPEQLDGDLVDARSDQYAFCVALWEALHGERPFPDDAREARRAKRARDLPPATRNDVPSFVHEVIVRGLSANPDHRFSSMTDILQHLGRAPRSKGRWLVAGVAAVAVVGAAVATRSARIEYQRCTGGPDRLAPVWSPARADTIGAAFASLAAPQATAAWQRTRALIELYATAWLDGHREACLAATGPSAGDRPVRDLRQTCLNDRLGHLDALLGALQDPDEATVQRAAKAASGLPALAACADVEYLRARVPPPEDAETAQRVEALRDRIRQAYARESAGRYESGSRLADEALTDARALGYAPVIGELLRRSGSLAMQRGDYEDAVGLLREAFMLSAGARDDETAAQCAIDLSFATSMSARYAEGETWLRHAQMLSEAASLPAPFHARRADRLGHIRSQQGRHDEALQQHRRALDLLRQLDEPDLGTVAQYEMHTAIALSDLERYDESAAHYRLALTHFQAVLGPAHPDVGIVRINLGMLHNSREEHHEAIAQLQRAQSILEAALGERHTYLGNVNMGLAVANAGLQRWDEALSFARQAVAVHEVALGKNHPQTADDLFNVGALAVNAERPEVARAPLQRALQIQVEVFGEDHPTSQTTRELLAELP